MSLLGLPQYVMRRFKSAASAQRFLTAFSGFYNHFRLRRHQFAASEHRAMRRARYEAWRELATVATAT